MGGTSFASRPGRAGERDVMVSFYDSCHRKGKAFGGNWRVWFFLVSRKPGG